MAYRDDHRGTVGDASQVAQHHPEAVVEGHRDAEPVGLGEPEQLGGEEPVVEDVAVAQGRALGIAGGARGVLDVDRVLGAELVGEMVGRPLPGAGFEERWR